MDTEIERIDRFLAAYLAEPGLALSEVPLARLLAAAGVVAARRGVSSGEFELLSLAAYTAGLLEALKG